MTLPSNPAPTPNPPSKGYKPVHGGYPGQVPRPLRYMGSVKGTMRGSQVQMQNLPRFSNDERRALI